MIKLKDFPAFRAWCEKFKDGFGLIDLLALDNKAKDCAVIAYCLDIGDIQHHCIAQSIHSEIRSEIYKNGIYQNFENNLLDLCDQFNIEVDKRNAELADRFNFESYIELDESFYKARRIDQDMVDAGHKWSDF